VQLFGILKQSHSRSPQARWQPAIALRDRREVEFWNFLDAAGTARIRGILAHCDCGLTAFFRRF
jgi:hypothetical protein